MDSEPMLQILLGTKNAIDVIKFAAVFSSRLVQNVSLPYCSAFECIYGAFGRRNIIDFLFSPFLFFFFKKDARPARWGSPDGWEPPGARSRKVGSLKKEKNGNAETENLSWC